MEEAIATQREITAGAVVTAPPAWVDLAPYDIPPAANPHFIANGICVLLDDSQIDLCGPERAWYYRRAEIVTAPAGAERAAQFTVAFDPAFERVEVHTIAVIRGEQRIDHTRNGFFEVLRRERNMERLQFDGRLTIHLTLPDVRQGDIVETSYTLYGMRKSLGGRHGAWIPFEWSVGITETRLRLRAPKHRKVAELALGDPPLATETESDGVIDRRWRTHERPGAKFEALTPPWVIQGASMQFSEWRDWAEVAQAFTPLYDDASPLSEDVVVEIARIAATEPTEKGRAAAILRFTQSEVRYLAISIGEGGYTPRALTAICETRYGDCKDKSKLFVAMARRLGLDACPALVNTRDGYGLDTWLPSGQVFDHCIVRLDIDGRAYWLDPTRSVQPSALEKVTQCHYGWALPLRPETVALERMPDPGVPHLTETHEHVTLGDSPDAIVRYEWKHVFRDVRAEGVREQFAREGEVGVFKAYAEDVQRTWPKARVVRQELVEDNEVANVVTIREVYEIPEAWVHAGGTTYKFITRDLMLTGLLAKLDPGERKCDIYLGAPGKRTRRVEVHSPFTLGGTWSKRHEGSTLTFVDNMKPGGPRQLSIEQTIEIRALTLPANEAELYRKVQTDLSGNDLAVTEQLSGGKFVGELKAGEKLDIWSTLRIILLVFVVLSAIVRCAGSAP